MTDELLYVGKQKRKPDVLYDFYKKQQQLNVFNLPLLVLCKLRQKQAENLAIFSAKIVKRAKAENKKKEKYSSAGGQLVYLKVSSKLILTRFLKRKRTLIKIMDERRKILKKLRR